MTDAVIALAFAFVVGCLVGAVAVEILVARHLKAVHADNARLRALIAPLDRDGDGRPGGSSKFNSVSLASKEP